MQGKKKGSWRREGVQDHIYGEKCYPQGGKKHPMERNPFTRSQKFFSKGRCRLKKSAVGEKKRRPADSPGREIPEAVRGIGGNGRTETVKRKGLTSKYHQPCTSKTRKEESPIHFFTHRIKKSLFEEGKQCTTCPRGHLVEKKPRGGREKEDRNRLRESLREKTPAVKDRSFSETGGEYFGPSPFPQKKPLMPENAK